MLNAFNQLIAKAPAGLNAVAMAEATAVGAGGPSAAIHTMSRGQFIGSKDDRLALVKPLLDVAPQTDKATVQELSYWDAAQIFLSGEPASHSFGDISRYAADPLPEAVTAKVVECPSRDEKNNGSFWS